MEIIKQIAGVAEATKEEKRYITAIDIQGEQKSLPLFKRPVSVFPDENGGFFVTSFGSNEVLQFNANGIVTQKISGGLAGFNHPFDVKISPNGYMYITEFEGDCVSRCTPSGKNIMKFGETGTKDGQLLGPQILKDKVSSGSSSIFTEKEGNIGHFVFI